MDHQEEPVVDFPTGSVGTRIQPGPAGLGDQEDITKEVDQLVQQLQVALAQASRVQMLQGQEDRSRPTYQVLLTTRQAQEEQIQQLTDQLQQAQHQLVVLQEDQDRERQTWVDQGVQAEAVRARRLELEARTSASYECSRDQVSGFTWWVQ
ncbi:hypothetical protein KC19_2G005300 [Ceratodon purpureus]|uniref:Uncharacterized protein n=1 Tax=Ceratodon purpureus TaxID=3225 RepID=A0A8T0IRS9_CERPU|nr:hypothetical protein KC19_2G005300 [Ceratodon purpureus]